MKENETIASGVTPGECSVDRIVRHFIVTWDDVNGSCFPLVWDEECYGAIRDCKDARKDRVALFTSRRSAWKAIRISKLAAALKREQGKGEKDCLFLSGNWKIDIMECLSNVRSDLSAPGANSATK
jgi:hypothetical protein